MNGPEHYAIAEELLANEPDMPASLEAIGHALLALVKTEAEHSEEIVTLSASLAHLADDMATPDDQEHAGGLTP